MRPRQRTSITWITFASLAAYAIGAASPVGAQLLPCDQAAMSSILSTYAGELKAEMKCAPMSPNADSEKCIAEPPGWQKLEDRLFATIAASCPVPAGNQTCADTAAHHYLDVMLPILTAGPVSFVDARIRKCGKAFAAGAAKLARTTATVLQRCNESALLAEPGYGPVGTACTDMSGTPQAMIAKAEDKLRAAIAKRCGGADHAMGGGDDLDPQDDLGLPETCYGPSPCNVAMPGVFELAECATCVTARSIEKATTGAQVLPIETDASCRLGFSGAFRALVERTLDARVECVDDRLDDPVAPACPSAEEIDEIAERESTALEISVSRCTGLDPQDDIAFPASCPDVGACASIDVSDFAGAAECARCVIAERTQLLVDALAPVQSFEADPQRLTCRAGLLDVSADFARRKVLRLSTCARARTCGQMTESCPDARATWYIDDRRRDIDIEIECGTLDPQDLGFDTTCPALYSCGGTDTESIDGLKDCITCIADSVADELNGLYVTP
jgi:hypothetical protein